MQLAFLAAATAAAVLGWAWGLRAQQLLSETRAQLHNANHAAVWWRTRALAPKVKGPPPLPPRRQPQEPFWSSAVTILRESP
jgi:hypothetical protein